MTTTTDLPVLNARTLSILSNDRLQKPVFDRDALPTSVLHIGPGAFFRAHQMDYYDRLNETDPSWGVVAVALRSRGSIDKLSAQDGLYTLVTLDHQISYRVISSLKAVLHRTDDEALAVFTSPDLQLVTLTITEKGYCLSEDGTLDFGHAEVAHDLASAIIPVSAIGWLVAGLARRRASGLTKLVVLSCDNLPDNGQKLQNAVLAYADRLDPELAQWIRKFIEFPSSMVDSITPATDDALIQRVEAECGVYDAWPIQREAFTSWVIENTGAPVLRRLADSGVLLTVDVSRHEKAKLWLLNGAHSTLAYLGLAYGLQSVSDTMENEELRSLIRAMMRKEILPALTAPDGMNLETYIEDLLDRFANPAIVHRLSQIAWDGSKKLPIRLLNTIETNLIAGRSIDRLALGVAAWMRFVVRMCSNGQKITDPIADQLTAIGFATEDTEDDVDAFLSLKSIFGNNLPQNELFVRPVKRAYGDIIKTEQKYLTGGSEVQ